MCVVECTVDDDDCAGAFVQHVHDAALRREVPFRGQRPVQLTVLLSVQDLKRRASQGVIGWLVG
jgi:hypothetical protein